MRFTHDRNILAGDNESGKSTIPAVLDLVRDSFCTGSRHCVESPRPSQQGQFQGKVSAAPISYPR